MLLSKIMVNVKEMLKGRDRSKLYPVKRMVTRKGKTFPMTVYKTAEEIEQGKAKGTAQGKKPEAEQLFTKDHLSSEGESVKRAQEKAVDAIREKHSGAKVHAMAMVEDDDGGKGTMVHANMPTGETLAYTVMHDGKIRSHGSSGGKPMTDDAFKSAMLRVKSVPIESVGVGDYINTSAVGGSGVYEVVKILKHVVQVKDVLNGAKLSVRKQSDQVFDATGYAKLLTSGVKTGANLSAWVNVATEVKVIEGALRGEIDRRVAEKKHKDQTAQSDAVDKPKADTDVSKEKAVVDKMSADELTGAFEKFADSDDKELRLTGTYNGKPFETIITQTTTGSYNVKTVLDGKVAREMEDERKDAVWGTIHRTAQTDGVSMQVAKKQ